MRALLLALAVSRLAVAELRESPAMALVEQLASDDTLVVFDLDNTLIEPVQTLGSDQWYYHLVAQLQAQGRDETQAHAEANAIWNRVQLATAVRPVEADTPDRVARLQARGLRVMALTARTQDVSSLTARQLESVGYTLAKSAFGRDELVLDADAGEIYREGVLYVGEHASKGQALLAFLAKVGVTPARVVFVDDKEKHARSVDATLTAAGIPVVAIRYGAADARVRAFDPAVADLQYKAWSRLLSDEEARELLGQPPR